MLQLNVCAKCFIERFICFWPSARHIGLGLFDADGFMAVRALAETVTGAIHLVPWPKPTYIGQFWPFHAVSFPQAGQVCQSDRFQTAPLPKKSRTVQTTLESGRLHNSVGEPGDVQ